MSIREIESLAALDQLIRTGSVSGARLQDLDLTSHESELLQVNDFRGVVVLGGVISQRLEVHLRQCGAIVFHTDEDGLPVDAYRGALYTYEDLYDGLPGEGYGRTPDATTYAWSRLPETEHDAYATLLRATHDDSIGDALRDWVDGRDVVGIMGGHAVQRGTAQFTDAAQLGARLADAGLTVATGGGPGAMEAANLGALLGDSISLTEALTALAACPNFHDSVDGWAESAWEVRHNHAPAGDHRSVGVPTWFYGHEPPNLFGNEIAKYFSNALREDVLLNICNAGIIVLPGAAGTVQEIFQAVTPRYYAKTPGPPLVLVGIQQWTETIPVWPALEALAANSPLGQSLHLVESTQDAASLILQR